MTTIALKVRLVHRTKYNTFGPNEEEPCSLKLVTLLFGYKTKELEGFWTTNHLLSPFHAGPFFDISFCMWLPCFKHGTKSKKRITMFLALFASCACSRILSWVTIYLWRVYFTISRKIMIFWVDFVAGNSNKWQKLGLDECVHTWANRHRLH